MKSPLLSLGENPRGFSPGAVLSDCPEACPPRGWLLSLPQRGSPHGCSLSLPRGVSPELSALGEGCRADFQPGWGPGPLGLPRRGSPRGCSLSLPRGVSPELSALGEGCRADFQPGWGPGPLGLPRRGSPRGCSLSLPRGVSPEHSALGGGRCWAGFQPEEGIPTGLLCEPDRAGLLHSRVPLEGGPSDRRLRRIRISPSNDSVVPPVPDSSFSMSLPVSVYPRDVPRRLQGDPVFSVERLRAKPHPQSLPPVVDVRRSSRSLKPLSMT